MVQRYYFFTLLFVIYYNINFFSCIMHKDMLHKKQKYTYLSIP